MRLARDLLGRRYGRLIVLAKAEPGDDKRARWLVQCDCGTKKVVRQWLLLRGRTSSCGCLARELTVRRSRTHGMTNSPEWLTWRRMRARCYNENCDSYPHYGGRGIRVCDRWLESFQSFLEDMGPRPTDRHSIDRINVNGDYEPNNCRWATPEQQGSNRTCNRVLTANGETAIAAEWARRAGVSQTTINNRLERGWPVEKAVTAPDQRWKHV